MQSSAKANPIRKISPQATWQSWRTVKGLKVLQKKQLKNIGSRAWEHCGYKFTLRPELLSWTAENHGQTGEESWLHKAILWPPPHTYDGPNTHTDSNNRNTGTRCSTAQGESIGAGYTPVINPDIGFRLWNCWSCLALSSTVMAQMSRLPAVQRQEDNYSTRKARCSNTWCSKFCQKSINGVINHCPWRTCA